MIYTVRLLPSDLLRMRSHKSMGLMHHGDVARDRLLAKLRLPFDATQPPLTDQQRFDVLVSGPLLAYIELAAVVQNHMAGLKGDAQIATVARIVETLEAASATRELIRSTAAELMGCGAAE